MLEEEAADGMADVAAALEAAGRPYRISNGELNTRCGICGDSQRDPRSRHFYVSMAFPHPNFCQRCGHRSDRLTAEVLASLGAEDADAYARRVSREWQRSGRRRQRAGLHLGAARLRMEVPPPCRSDPADAAAVGYVEERLGFRLEDREVQRYKLVACGLYGLLEANGITQLTVPAREAQRLNDTCVGWLSADESYVVFRNTDPAWEAAGGRRYTNYRIHRSWEGSKVFACRSDVDILSPRFRVVVTEGILDLMAVEREFYREERWGPGFVGAAANGSTQADALRMVMGLGVLSPEADLYPDREDGSMGRVRRALRAASPLMAEPGFGLQVYQNGYPGEKDFGVPRERMRRVRARAA